jgi:hypothetical protein
MKNWKKLEAIMTTILPFQHLLVYNEGKEERKKKTWTASLQTQIFRIST